MFFSKVVLFAISLGALSVLATPHALHHHALHRRVVAARAAVASTNATAIRQNSHKCNHHPPASSSSSIPAPTHIVAAPNPAPPATTPTPTPKPSTSTPQQPAPTTTPSKSQPPSGAPPGLGGTLSGQGTFYAPGLGACGDTNNVSDNIVAISHSLFDSISDGGNPNNNQFCHRQVIITGPNGHTQTATIEDRCQGCQMFDLDMTPDLFSQFSDPSVGRIQITWRFA